MAQVTGTFSSYDAVGQREDLTDIIYSIAPTDTPFMSGIAKEQASAVFHEWQTDSLAAATANNAQIEGDEISFSAPSATTRLGNRTQISRKSVIVSGTLDTVSKAGRNNELAYQISKASKELKRDMETILTANQAPVTGNDSTAITVESGQLVQFVGGANISTAGSEPDTITIDLGQNLTNIESISSATSNANLTLASNGTGDVVINDTLTFSAAASTPTASAVTKIYNKTAGGGGTGLFFINSK